MKAVREGLEFETRVGGKHRGWSPEPAPDEKNEEYHSTQSCKEPVTRLV